MKTKLFKLGLPLVVVLVAASAGYLWFTKQPSVEQKERARLLQLVKQSDATFQQYFNADYTSAKAAMLDHVRFLDEVGSQYADSLRNPAATDANSWYVRLAKLEEKHNGSEKAVYMREACARCAKRGVADCSEETLRRQVDSQDQIAVAKLNRE